MKKFMFMFLFSIPSMPYECRELQDTLKFLSSDRLLGRVPGTPEHAEARKHISEKLTALGADVFEQEFPNGVNLWGTLYPQGNRSGKPEVLISAHYDHVAHCNAKKGASSPICNGAADNSGAVAALVNVLGKLRTTVNKPVAFAVFDREEENLAGSEYFVNSGVLPSIRLVLNMDIIGLNLFSGMENVHLTMGSETGGDALVRDLEAATQKSGLDGFRFSYALAHGRGDLTNFIKNGVPSIHFTDGDGSVYHSQADEFQYLNQSKILKISDLVFYLTLLAEKNGPYEFKNPIQNDYALPLFTDVKVGEKLVAKINKTVRTPKTSSLLRELNKIIKKGERSFSFDEMNSFQEIAFELMEYSRKMEEIPQGNQCE